MSESPRHGVEGSGGTAPPPASRPFFAAWCRWTWRSHLILGAAGLLFGALGFFYGSHALLGFAPLTLIAAGAALLFVLINLLIAAVRRLPAWRGLRVRIVCASLCWCSLVAAAYFVFWLPVRTVYGDWDRVKSMSPADMRRLCHRMLLWNSDPHDEFIWLMRGCGDETSVPHILWALRWMPEEGEAMACTWAHGIEALETITNNSPGNTREAWVRWFAVNKRRTALEWWADGFTAQGYPVSPAGGDASIRNLLGVLGRREWCQSEERTWLSTNATRMLQRLDEARVRLVMTTVEKEGSVPERRGLARYSGELTRDEAEPNLTRLLSDEDGSVRLWASGALCSCKRKWLRNPGRFIVEQHEPGELNPEVFFSPEGKDVLAGIKGNHIPWAASEGLSREIDITPDGPPVAEPVGPKCVIRIDYQSAAYRASARLSIEGRAVPSGAVKYSRELITSTRSDVEELIWLLDSSTGRLFLSIPGFTCLVEMATGRVIWEMGFGTGNCDDLFVLGDYLLIDDAPDLVVSDAARGGILATFRLEGEFFRDRLSLVDGCLRGTDGDGRLYVIEMPELHSANGK